MITNDTVFTKDLQNKKLIVTRLFNAPVSRVWEAWTTSEILDQWWAPKPYRAETKTMKFEVGGHWLYCMVGPKGDRTWCMETYEVISAEQLILSRSNFCDEDGILNADFPTMHWSKTFNDKGNTAEVLIEIRFDSESDLETIIKMGFQEGFRMGLTNLDNYLESHKQGENH